MTMPDHKPITEAELAEMEAWLTRVGAQSDSQMRRLITEVRRLHGVVESYAVESNWIWGTDTMDPIPGHWRVAFFVPPHPDYRNAPGYKLAREALGWGPLDEPCDNPSCDGVKDDPNYPGDGPDGMVHRCFKDGHWLDDGSKM